MPSTTTNLTLSNILIHEVSRDVRVYSLAEVRRRFRVFGCLHHQGTTQLCGRSRPLLVSANIYLAAQYDQQLYHVLLIVHLSTISVNKTTSCTIFSYMFISMSVCYFYSLLYQCDNWHTSLYVYDRLV